MGKRGRGGRGTNLIRPWDTRCWCKKCTLERKAVNQGSAFDSSSSTGRRQGRRSLSLEVGSVKASKVRGVDVPGDGSERACDNERVESDDRGTSLF